MYSAAYREGVPAERKLRFVTARELANETPLEVPWIARPWVAAGAATEIHGQIKTAGKTTFALHLCAAVVRGEAFLDIPTVQGPVIYLTEQGTTSFYEALSNAGLLDRDDFIILTWHQTYGVPWETVVAAAIRECRRRGARVLVVDTLPQFAALDGDKENKTGDALGTMQPLQMAFQKYGLAVVMIRHERKTGGSVSQAARGSTAFGGAVDLILSISRTEGQGNPNVRIIRAEGRFEDTPREMAIELGPDGYRSIGSPKQFATQRNDEAILAVVPANREAAKTLEDVMEAAGRRRSAVQESLSSLSESDRVQRVGVGKRGEPYRYWKPEPGEILSAATPTPEAAA